MPHGRSINVGKWIERADGRWVLRIEPKELARRLALDAL
jgi:hypothetical protein